MTGVLAHGAFHVAEVVTLVLGATVPFVVLVGTMLLARRRDQRPAAGDDPTA